MARTRYKQLVDTLADDIRSGRLPAGTRLPTHRQLAIKYGLALVTATRVYAELEMMGLVSGEVGRGTFVREILLSPTQGIDQVATAVDMIDLNFNYPSLPKQTDMLRKALRQLASSGNLDSLLRYQPHGGHLHERTIIARYLESQNLVVDAQQVFIVNGAQHGLATTVLALLRPGDILAVDALTYPGIKVVAKMYHIELVPIPASAQGFDLNTLEALCQKRAIRAIYTMPTLHNPLGWVLSLEWREQLIKIARKNGILIIEDAAYAFLEDNAPPPLAALAPDITVYVSGFSKNIATGLRVGFITVPPKWHAAIERIIRATAWNTPGVMTALICAWLEDGTVLQLEEEKRQDARIRQKIVHDILNGFQYIAHHTSYFVWLPLGEEVRADQVAMALLNEYISVSTAEPFATSNHVPHAIRLALGSVQLDTLKDALQNVKKVIQHYTY